MGFEKRVAFLQFVVFVHGIEINRTHRIELAGKLVDDFTEFGFIETCCLICDRFPVGFSALLKLRTKGFREGITIWHELA